MADAAVGPDVAAQAAGLGGALQHGGELRAADAGHHPGGAHGARPDADLEDVRARLDQVAHAAGGDDVARGDGHPGVERADGLQGRDHLFLVAVRGVHDQAVDPGLQQLLRLGGHVAVDADGGGDAEPAPGVDGRRVEGGPQRAGPGQDADQAAVAVDDGGEPVAALVEPVERLAGVEPGGQGEQVVGHDVGQLGVHVHAVAVGLGDDADRAVVPVDDDDRAVGPLGQEVERLADGVVRGEGERGVVDQVALLHPVDDVGDDVDRDVLRDHGDPAAAGHGLGHPAPGDRGHVGDDDGDRGPGAVGGGQVDGEPGSDRGARRDHEHVAVGQVVGRNRLIEKLHVHLPYR
nr:hypothetical protein GCM10020093_045810 [Planobispora longispora]